MKKTDCKTGETLVTSEAPTNCYSSFCTNSTNTVSTDVLLGGYDDVSWLASVFETGMDVNSKSFKCALYKEKELD